LSGSVVNDPNQRLSEHTPERIVGLDFSDYLRSNHLVLQTERIPKSPNQMRLVAHTIVCDHRHHVRHLEGIGRYVSLPDRHMRKLTQIP
jgi:hypothetical protein